MSWVERIFCKFWLSQIMVDSVWKNTLVFFFNLEPICDQSEYCYSNPVMDLYLISTWAAL